LPPDERARGIRASLLILLGIILGFASYGTWAVRTWDFGLRQAIPGKDVGGTVLIALAAILVGAGLAYLFGVGAARTVALVSGTAGFIYAAVRAAQLGAEDFPLAHVTEVTWALWLAVVISALTIPVTLVGAPSAPRNKRSAGA
jgi:hypothetical protein